MATFCLRLTDRLASRANHVITPTLGSAGVQNVPLDQF
ncbi:hypothetical protein EV660_11084 [Roseinatronobacter bogoriensis DSM 18756]|nr:hypothetical protein [Rhodobaca bogoriensis DSM 18756]TDY66635.1 hypothetical protein EV660_11084 [Rhodobaca bogoriensis DSM 18756]